MHRRLLRRLQLTAQVLLKGETPAGARREIPALTPEEVAEARAFFPLDKFFIFGHARSGTTLLTRLVRVHPQVHCNYQGHFFTRAPLLEGLVDSEAINLWLGRRSNRWNRGRDLSPLVMRAAADFIMERDARYNGKHAPGSVVGDKSPNSLLDGKAVQLMNNIYPDARLIFIVRDGRDAALSHRFQAFIDRPQHLKQADLSIRAAFIADPEPYLNGQRSLFTSRGLRQAAEGWAHNVQDTHQTALDLLGDRYHFLRYEDLLAHPLAAMQTLWDFLGVDAHLPELEASLQAELNRNPDADWQQEKASEIAGALQKGVRGTWREMFTTQDRQVFRDAAGPTLVEWRYEANLDG